MTDHKTANSENGSEKETLSLNRWARRKAQVQTAEAGDAAPAVIPEAQAQAEEEPELTDEDMPALDTLDADSDYKQFFSPKVSESVRRLALNKLFHSGSFGVLDGLNDYDEDYTTFEALGNIVTSDMKHLIEVEEERKMRAEAEAENRAFDEAKLAEQDAQTLEKHTEENLTNDETSDVKTDHIADSTHNEEPGAIT